MAEYYNESRDSLKDRQGLPVGKLAKRTVLVDNEVTRVSYFELEPGDNTGWHKHESDYAALTLQTPSYSIRGLMELNSPRSTKLVNSRFIQLA